MSKLYVISDCHFGHKNIAKYRPQFKTAEEHDEYVLNNIKSAVTKRDTLYFMGDICFTTESIQFIKSIVCNKKVLVMGNHDAERGGMKKVDLFEAFDDVTSLVTKKGCWLSHAPIHPDELRGKFNIHGHTHNHNVNDYRYANVSCENVGYRPVELLDVKAVMERGEIFGDRTFVDNPSDWAQRGCTDDMTCEEHY